MFTVNIGQLTPQVFATGNQRQIYTENIKHVQLLSICVYMRSGKYLPVTSDDIVTMGEGEVVEKTETSGAESQQNHLITLIIHPLINIQLYILQIHIMKPQLQMQVLQQ